MTIPVSVWSRVMRRAWEHEQAARQCRRVIHPGAAMPEYWMQAAELHDYKAQLLRRWIERHEVKS